MVPTITTGELANILAKDASLRSDDEIKILDNYSSLIPRAIALNKSREAREALNQRNIEQEESIEVIEQKSVQLAKLIKESKYTIIYTGAGISTSASIPDYRGPNGLWTQIRKTGSFSMTQVHDLTTADPTYTHMAIRELCRRKLIKHVVSQNCDGLHLRSGIPQKMLSEIHGNMYIEVCPACEHQHYREADLTEKTSRFRHKTGRKCHKCKNSDNNTLNDTIVLFGERSRTKWPMNWECARKAADKATLIICLGSSLKTLRRYECLWPKRLSGYNAKRSIETKLAIVNLQYTSKDKHSILKINGRCDKVMQLVMDNLKINVPNYEWIDDPLYRLAIPFNDDERSALKGQLLFEYRLLNDEKMKVLSISPASSKNTIEENIIDRNDTTINIQSVLTNTANCLNEGLNGRHVKKTLGLVDSEEKLLNLQNINQTTRVQSKPILPGWLGKGLGGASSRYVPKKRRRRNTKPQAS